MKHKFVDFIPDNLEDRVIYIAMEFGTVVHNCCCGCGNEVYTPLSPTDWKIIYDGESISLKPSIGNWNFECQSHYWITNNSVKWSGKWTKKEIELGRSLDKQHKINYYNNRGNNLTTRKIKQEINLNRPSFLGTKILSKIVFWLKKMFRNSYRRE